MKISFQNFCVFFLIAIMLASCKSCNKKPVKVSLSVAYISSPESCPSDEFSSDIVQLFCPFEIGDSAAGIPLGTVYRLDVDPMVSVAVSTENYDLTEKLKNMLFPSKEKTMAQLKSDYKKAVKSIKAGSLCASQGTTDTAKSIQLMLNLIRSYGYSDVFIFSKTGDSTWHGYKVYTDISLLRDQLANLYSGSVNEKALVIIGQLGNAKDTSPHIVPGPTPIPPPPPPPITKKVLDVLMSIRDTNSTEKQRLAIVEQAMKTIFSKDFSVVMHEDAVNGSIRSWDAGKGIDYLQRLATYNAVTGFEVISVHTNTTDQKVSDIELVEKH